MKSISRLWCVCTALFSCLLAFNSLADRPLTTLQVTAGDFHSLALRSDGTVWSWGTNSYGALGRPELLVSSIPVRVPGLSNIVRIAAGSANSFAIDQTGIIYAWGANTYGQLGNGTTTISTNPVQVSTITNATFMAVGEKHVIAACKDGRVFVWGDTSFGQSGNWTGPVLSPYQMTFFANAVGVAAGSGNSWVLTTRGEVWAWGAGNLGGLGAGGGYGNTITQTKISALSNIVQIAGGRLHCLAMGNNGKVWAWGVNDHGELGNATISVQAAVQVGSATNFVEVCAGPYSSYARDKNNKIWFWGFNDVAVTTPTALASTEPLSGMAAGYYHQLAINRTGEVWSWGRNTTAQLGNENTDSSYVAEPVMAFSPTPKVAPTRVNRGVTDNMNFVSAVLSLEFEKGVALYLTANESYNFPFPQPWFLRTARQRVLHVGTQTTGTNFARFAVENPVTAFGGESGLSPLYTQRPYTFGFQAGGIDEGDDTGTNAIRILVYSRSSFANGATNVSPTATNYLSLPRRTVSAETNLWINFVTNGLSKTLDTNSLKTTLELVQGKDDSSLPWSLSYKTNAIGVPTHLTNYFSYGYRLTHTGSDTNLFYKIDLKSKVQASTNLNAYFSTNSGGQWDYTPLYTLDFAPELVQRPLLVDRPMFEGIAIPPPYLDKNIGPTMAVTSAYTITNTAFTNLDTSPELRRHPVLDQFVEKMGRDPLALANYVINEIELTDPLAKADVQNTITTFVNGGGVNRNALTTFLEGQGSPTEQCALLVYLLRQAGVQAAYVFPTNNNIRIRDTRLSRLWQLQVRGVVRDDGTPVMTNALVSVGYPWVTANIVTSGVTNNVNIFPWLKDTEIVEGENLYDFMPASYDTANKFIYDYLQAKTNILALDLEHNTLLSLFPKFVSQQLASYPPARGLDFDSLGLRVFNRRNLYPTFANLPNPDFVTNTTQVSVVGTLSDSATTYPVLTNIFDIARVNVYKGSVATGNLILSTTDWLACELNNRKMLVYTNTSTNLSLWMSAFSTNYTTAGNFTGPSGGGKQVTNTTLSGSDDLLYVQIIHSRRVAAYGDPDDKTTNLVSCSKGDVAAVCINFGRVTPAMERFHFEDFLTAQRQRALTNSLVPLVPDNEGSAAYLLGLSFYEKTAKADEMLQRTHKIRSLLSMAGGLAILGHSSTTAQVLPKVDMVRSSVVLANGSLHYDNGDDFFQATSPFSQLAITSSSSLEHEVINSTFPSKSAISTVRLLQLASLRAATNSSAGMLILTKKDFSAKGNVAYTGYGTNLLKNVDPQSWATVSNYFILPQGETVVAYVPPGGITNESKSYIGWGALVFSKGSHLALISGNGANNGGSGDLIPTLHPNSPSAKLPYKLVVDSIGSPTFVYNDTSLGGLYVDYSPADLAYFDSLESNKLTPDQVDQISMAGASMNLPQDANSTLKIAQSSGDQGQAKGWIRNLWEPVVDPVSVVSGEFYIDTVDLNLPGPLPLQLRRNYLSRSPVRQSLGYGWKLGFNPQLVLFTKSTQTYIQAADPDGAVVVYRPTVTDQWAVFPDDNPSLMNDNHGGKGGVYNAFNAKITRSTTNGNSVYILTTPQGHRRQYQVISSFGITNNPTYTLDRTRPYLIRWEDHAGNFHKFSYGTNSTANDYGQMNRIESGTGNFIAINYDTGGRIIEAFTGDGRRVNYTYDGFGDLISVVLPDNSKWQYEYQHYRFSITNNGVTTTNLLDSNHLLTKESKPNGRLLVNIYDSLRRVTQQAATVGTNFNPVTNAYFYYTNNLATLTNNFITGATRVDDAFHNPTVYYYTNNNIGRIVDPVGRLTVQDWFDSTETNKFGYYPHSLEFSVDARGLKTSFYYDSSGNLTTNILYGNLTGTGLTNEVSTNVYTYVTNLLKSATDPSQNSVEYFYEESSDPFLVSRQIRKANGTAISTNYAFYTNISQVVSGKTNQAFGLPWRTVRAGGATNDNYFDGRGFPVQTIAYPSTAEFTSTDLPVTNTVLYNARGQLYQSTDGVGGTVTFDFDAMGRTKSKEIRSETGELVSAEYFYYNRNGELEWLNGPRVNPDDLSWFAYDGGGRKVVEQKWRSQARLDGDGVEAVSGNNAYATSFWEYDAFGNLLKFTNPRGVLTTNGWDAIGRLLTRTVFETNGTALATELFSYEPGGEVTIYTNALGGVSTTLFTSSGKPTFKQAPGGATNGWNYYLDGRLKREYLTSGSYWETTYDDVNRTAIRVYWATNTISLATNIVFFDRRGNQILTFDALGFGTTNKFDGLDRLKSSEGPIVTSFVPDGVPQMGTPIKVQQTLANYYGVAGRALTNVNALGEKTISFSDVLGRNVRTEIRSAANAVVRESSASYSSDHHSVTVTNGSGTSAIVSTAYSDTEGHNVLSINYPSGGIKQFVLQDFDSAGNLVFRGQYGRTNQTQFQFTGSTFSYDGLNRLTVKRDRDGAGTTNIYDSAGNLTEQDLPGGLVWKAGYTTAGQMVTNCNAGTDGSPIRANTFTYYPAGNSWAGLLSSHTDARGVVCTNYYDSWLRISNEVYTGTLDEQNMSTTWQYDVRGLMTSVAENYTTNSAGTNTTIQRIYDPYRNLVNESVSFGTNFFSSANAFDSAGRRQNLGLGSFGSTFGWQADGRLISVSTVTKNSAFGWDSAGLLTNRTSGTRSTTTLSRDGVGRPLSVETKITPDTYLIENLSYTGDGLIWRQALGKTNSFNDTHIYTYADQSRRLTSETLNIDASTTWTNSFVFDQGATAGAGVLTRIVQSGTSGADWNAHMDKFLRIDQETNNVVRRLASGRVNMKPGYATLGLQLDGQPVPFLTLGNADTNWPTKWQAQLEILPGTHSLTATAIHPSKLFTNSTSITFTNNAVDQTTISYYSEGQLTNRVWRNSSNVVNRTQTFQWDAKGRFLKFSERDASNNGHSWNAVYDAFGRRWQVKTVPVTNNAEYSSQTKIFTQVYDPLYEFLEIGVYADGRWQWKVHGPDRNGVYGKLNGLGGIEAIVGGPDSAPTSYNPVLSDIRGNILGVYDGQQVRWSSAHITAFGSIPGHRPLSIGEGQSLWESSSWFGKHPELSGLYNLGARYYDPVGGRFLSPDPCGHSSSVSLYEFAGGDPANGFDADGRQGISFFQAAFPAHASLMGAKPWTGSLAGDIQYSRGALAPAYIGAAVMGNPRVQGGMQFVSGTMEAGTGVFGFVTTSETGVGAVISGAAILHGADNAQAGWRQMTSGEPTSPYTAQGISYVTGSKTAGNVGNAVIGLSLTFGASIYAEPLTLGESSVTVTKVGETYVKAVNQDASALGRWWGEMNLNQQVKDFAKLGDMAPEFTFKNGVLTTADAGQYVPGNFWSTWFEGSMRLGTPFNDIRPRNIGAEGIIFDPSKNLIQQTLEGVAVGLSVYGGYEAAKYGGNASGEGTSTLSKH